MTLTHILFLAVPAALLALKLALLVLGALWAIRGAFDPRILPSTGRRRPLPAPVRGTRA